MESRVPRLVPWEECGAPACQDCPDSNGSCQTGIWPAAVAGDVDVTHETVQKIRTINNPATRLMRSVPVGIVHLSGKAFAAISVPQRVLGTVIPEVGWLLPWQCWRPSSIASGVSVDLRTVRSRRDPKQIRLSERVVRAKTVEVESRKAVLGSADSSAIWKL
jgi:hypothetical protein